MPSPPTCSDTDGGNVPEVQGTVTYVFGEVTDFCRVSDGRLNEYFCWANNSLGSEHITCANGCVDGECVADPPVTDFRIFSSSVSYNGNLGGLAGADTKCESLATTAGLGGNWMAWLSDDFTSAQSRLFHSPVPYVKVNGVQVADNWADLTDGTLDSGISTNELGTGVFSSVFTGTNFAGVSTGKNCNGWTIGLNSTNTSATYGSSFSTSSTWSAHGVVSACANEWRIYCVEQP